MQGGQNSATLYARSLRDSATRYRARKVPEDDVQARYWLGKAADQRFRPTPELNWGSAGR